MRKLKKYIYTISIVASLLCGSCRREVIIPKDKMSDIITELYLADQYISVHHKYSVQRDSTRLFAAILNEYGYTEDDYRRSTSYYLERKDSYENILAAAKEMLVERQQALREKIHRDSYQEEILSDTNRLKDNYLLKSFIELTKKLNTPVSATDTIPLGSSLCDICFTATKHFSIKEGIVEQTDSVKSNIIGSADTLFTVKTETKLNAKDPRIISWEEEDSNKDVKE